MTSDTSLGVTVWGEGLEQPDAARIYPVKDRSGQLVPNTYLVTFEDATNGDYQDYVFLLTNARPTSSGSAG